MLGSTGQVLRVFVGETDKYQGVLVYEWLLKKAKEHGLAGGTAVRGIAGFGAHSQMHSSKILDISANLPVVIEIIDMPDKIEQFLPFVEEAIKEGLATIEPAQIRLFRKQKN